MVLLAIDADVIDEEFLGEDGVVDDRQGSLAHQS
jgi:hypothetical protein